MLGLNLGCWQQQGWQLRRGAQRWAAGRESSERSFLGGRLQKRILKNKHHESPALHLLGLNSPFSEALLLALLSLFLSQCVSRL